VLLAKFDEGVGDGRRRIGAQKRPWLRPQQVVLVWHIEWVQKAARVECARVAEKGIDLLTRQKGSAAQRRGGEDRRGAAAGELGERGGAVGGVGGGGCDGGAAARLARAGRQG
jgi:hypothetical protein